MTVPIRHSSMTLYIILIRLCKYILPYFTLKRGSPLLKQIICISNHSWNDSPARTQQLMSRMRDVQILFFCPPEHSKIKKSKKRAQKVRPNITVYHLPAPFFPSLEQTFPVFFEKRQVRTARFIADRAAHHRFRTPLLWTTHPDHSLLLDSISYEGLVYDCDCVWSDSPPQREGHLANIADLVFVSCAELKSRLSPCNENIALLPSGVNYPLFATTPSPSAGAAPTFGWAGELTAELDLSPVLFTANKHPEWDFLLIGTQSVKNSLIPQLKQLSNVRFLPDCPLSALPDQLGRCHVLLELQDLSLGVTDMVSTRLYEYLSTGKPIVSMLWADQIEQFPDVVYGANNNMEFAQLCSHAMDEPHDFVSERRRNYGSAASWSNRTTEILQILTTTGLV